MGSRVSVVEKRLDETREHLLIVDRLRDKTSAHTTQIKNIGETVASLCKLFGVEDRLGRTIQDAQVCLTNFRSSFSDGACCPGGIVPPSEVTGGFDPGSQCWNSAYALTSAPVIVLRNTSETMH